MKLIQGLDQLSLLHAQCVATIGSFDAIHLGHQAIIQRVQQKAQSLGIPSAVILFEPQPREFFAPESAPKRVLQLQDKLQVLDDLGVDIVVCLNFNADLAALTKVQFVQQVIVEGLQAKHLVIGDDFRFGQGREGDFDYLVEVGKAHEFTVEATPTVSMIAKVDAHRRVSSSWVRAVLASGDFEKAAKLLNRSYCLSGKVEHGDKRGRQIGFPTANIVLAHEMVVHGVYVVCVRGLPQDYFGVANVGRRPTVDGTKRLLEVYLLDFAGDLYGQDITIEFLHHCRDEQKFDTVAALIVQIEKDVAAARAYLS